MRILLDTSTQRAALSGVPTVTDHAIAHQMVDVVFADLAKGVKSDFDADAYLDYLNSNKNA